MSIRIEVTCPKCEVVFGAECKDALMVLNSVNYWELNHECEGK